uniref:uncharacterized protein n=1 Tax=Myxine glutinosa TaxID=7769 RepID=UPI00358F6426
MSSDASAAEDSEDSSSGFCCMHVINTHSKVISFSEKSVKKFQECAAKWIELEGSPESKVAVKARQVQQHSQHRLGLGTGVGIAAADAAASADECETSGRRQHCTPGYHAECYRHFCNITTINRAIARYRRKKEADETQAGSDDSPHDEPPDPAPKRLLRSNIHVSDGQQTEARQLDRKHVLPVQCIICKSTQYIKEQRTGKRKVEKLVQCETKQGGQLVTAAIIKQDEALLLHCRDKDLVALEARYHKSCYLRYIKVLAKSIEISKQEYQQQMYEKSYISFCKKVIEERIIRGKEILRLSKLYQLFIKEVRELENTDASSYKTGRLKARLKRSHPVLCFGRPSRQIESDIVFVESLCVEEVVEYVVKGLSSGDSECCEIVDENQPGGSSSHHLRDMFHAAQILQESINNAPNPIEWPPTAADTTLEKAKEIVPTELYNFLAWMTGASSEPRESGVVHVPDELHHRLLSVAQDMMYLKAKGRILLPKHTSLAIPRQMDMDGKL